MSVAVLVKAAGGELPQEDDEDDEEDDHVSNVLKCVALLSWFPQSAGKLEQDGHVRGHARSCAGT